MNSSDLKMPTEELPKVGQRVRVICVKEMVYMGNDNNSGSDWLDDGKGLHAIMFWEEIKDEKK